MKNYIDGVVGIGSNSTRMSLCVAGHPYKIIDRGYALTRLFEGLDDQKFLSKTSIDRTVTAILQMYDQAHSDYPINHFWIFATSALRDAKNKDEVIKRVFEGTGISIQIIPGQTEAYYSFIGAGAGIRTRYGVIDIGGGSTEVAVGHASKKIVTTSFQIGALRLMKEFPDMNFHHVGELLSHIGNVFAKQKKPAGIDVNRYIGVGGTFTTLRALYVGDHYFDKVKKHFSKEQVFEQMKNLFVLSPAQRENYPHMPKGRGDITPYGLAILYQMMEHLSLRSVEVGRGGNLDGWLITHSKRSL